MLRGMMSGKELGDVCEEILRMEPHFNFYQCFLSAKHYNLYIYPL